MLVLLSLHVKKRAQSRYYEYHKTLALAHIYTKRNERPYKIRTT